LRRGRRTTYHSEPSIEAPKSSTPSRLADRSRQNPRRHRTSSHTQAAGGICPDSVSELSDVGWDDTGLTLAGEALPR